ncbi:MAG: hypothetical protein AAF542_16670 [Pseudomonadota bacterium]
MSDLDDEVIERASEIPVLDRIVKPSKQKDLADLLIKIIQTNEAEDKASLTEYDVDVSSATLRDIDAKLSAALHTADQQPSLTIPMLTEIADFPVLEGTELPFQSGERGGTEQTALPTMHSVHNDTDAANSAQQPTSANQERVVKRDVFSFAEGEADAKSAGIQHPKPDFDLGLDTSQIAANQHTLFQEQLNQASKQIIDNLIAEHAVAIRQELENRIDSLKRELLGELSAQRPHQVEPADLPPLEINELPEPEGSDA